MKITRSGSWVMIEVPNPWMNKDDQSESVEGEHIDHAFNLFPPAVTLVAAALGLFRPSGFTGGTHSEYVTYSYYAPERTHI